MKIPDPQSPGPSASQVKTEETLVNVEGAITHVNQQLKEISKWNTPLISCTVQVLYLQELSVTVATF